MSTRPQFLIHVRAEIEKAKSEIFSNADRFNLLFVPVMNPGKHCQFFGRETTAPLQRMTANMILQIQDFTGSLFDAEARHYLNHTSDSRSARWLNGLVEDVRAQARKLVVDSRTTFIAVRTNALQRSKKELEQACPLLAYAGDSPTAEIAIPAAQSSRQPQCDNAFTESRARPPRAGIPAAPEMLGSQSGDSE